MIWFGSSAGVAISNSFPETRSVGLWLRHGWFVPVGYVVGFFALLAVLGWHPQEKRQRGPKRQEAGFYYQPAGASNGGHMSL